MKVFSQDNEYLGDFDHHPQDVMEISFMSGRLTNITPYKYSTFKLRLKTKGWLLVQGSPNDVKEYLKWYAQRNAK